MIDEETERAVAEWVHLADQVAGRTGGERQAACSRCGSTFRVLDRGKDAVCARCYLERGASHAR